MPQAISHYRKIHSRHQRNILFYKQLANFKGKRVEIYTIGDSNSNVETGILTDIVTSIGENGIFVLLDEKKLINIRHIIKIIVKE